MNKLKAAIKAFKNPRLLSKNLMFSCESFDQNSESAMIAINRIGEIRKGATIDINGNMYTVLDTVLEVVKKDDE